MGCFDVVCALTNTPIKIGEKCHLVLLKPDVSWDSLTWIMSHEGKLAFLRIFHGEYNDYGTVEDVEGLDDKGLELLQAFDDDRDKYKHFFVCDMAYQWAQDKFKDYIPYDIREERRYRETLGEDEPFVRLLKPEQQTIVRKDRDAREQERIVWGRLVLAFSRACKHPMAGLGLYHQYDGTEIERIEENLKLVQQRLEWMKEERRRIDIENGNENYDYSKDQDA